MTSEGGRADGRELNAHRLILGKLLPAHLELADHLLVRSALAESLEVIVDAAVEIVLDASRTWLELAWRSGYNIASQL